MILMYDREAKYDPTLEETSDELLRLFLDEIELYFRTITVQVPIWWQRKRKKCLLNNCGIARMQKDM